MHFESFCYIYTLSAQNYFLNSTDILFTSDKYSLIPAKIIKLIHKITCIGWFHPISDILILILFTKITCIELFQPMTG